MKIVRQMKQRYTDTYRRVLEMKNQQGKIGYILLWLLGVPIPVLFVFYLLRGCT